MKSSKLGKREIWYENSDEFYELKKEIFGENCYYLEPEMDNPRIIDAGAHIGLSTLYFKSIFPMASITAYEPIPSNYLILEKNIQENQLDGVELKNIAVAPKTGKLKLFEPSGRDAWKSGAGIIPKGWRGVQSTHEIEVQAIGILEILQEKIDIFKMDVEGMEYELLRNAKHLIQNVSNWIVESHPRSGHRVEEMIKIFEQNGYKVEQHKDQSSLGVGLSQIVAVLK